MSPALTLHALCNICYFAAITRMGIPSEVSQYVINYVQIQKTDRDRDLILLPWWCEKITFLLPFCGMKCV